MLGMPMAGTCLVTRVTLEIMISMSHISSSAFTTIPL